VIKALKGEIVTLSKQLLVKKEEIISVTRTVKLTCISDLQVTYSLLRSL